MIGIYIHIFMVQFKLKLGLCDIFVRVCGRVYFGSDYLMLNNYNKPKSVQSVFPVVVPVLPVHDPLIDWYVLQIAKSYDPVRVPEGFGTRLYRDWVRAIRNVERDYFSVPCDYASTLLWRV
ncbi:hypothetical protein L1887_15307 [Cichorium endivia]|nr:hypothetical protein L1887_15307 [Cichorium endivia]